MTNQAVTKKQDTEDSKENAPIFVDLGKKKNKAIKKWRKGRGPLMDVIEETVEELKSSGTQCDNVQPVIFVVREKKKKAKFMNWYK